MSTNGDIIIKKRGRKPKKKVEPTEEKIPKSVVESLVVEK